MSKELDTFDKWWMMQSKIPYRDKKEIAQSAWEQSRTATLVEAQPAFDAMQEFCDRRDKGEVRSTYTYNKFKSELKAINNLKDKDK